MEDLITSQKATLGIQDFLNSAKNYTLDVFPEINLDNFFNTAIYNGKVDASIMLPGITRIINNEIKFAVSLMINVLVVIIIHSIFKSIIEGLENNSSSKIAYFAQYLIIVTLIINTFLSILKITKAAITDIISFMNLLIPLMTTLILTTGCITTTSIIQPLLIFLVSFMGNFINNVIIPILLISITLCIVSNISNKIQIDRLSKFLKSSIIWILGIILTIFSCLLSIEGTLGSSVDGLTGKTAKAAVSNFIPIVGKVLGDTVDSVIGCSNVLKNSVGIIGILIIAGIVLLPLIKLIVVFVSFYLTSAICEIVGDEKIVKLITQISDSYKILIAILLSVSVMFIIGITLVMKITNTALMYR